MRLRKLIVAGFKSFADRTEFVFDDGITCVVGPNGCGKSNVVDSVKWVLGEQSAKSLRGSEMMDVIFNGSSARKASGFAEVTLEFDDAESLQPVAVDAKRPQVVSVTRRLYRSGESEYLINGQTARLRDIREMFMDTGVGADAYSLIEQGRVAEMLQASAADRRAVFEEAAGISKYKARKKEALRKLERVEQNLLRVNDVLEEVQKRLRSIKYQAGKARSYQQYSEQLKELRSLYSLAQYHTLRAERSALQERLDQVSDRLSAMHARIDHLEANRSGTEAELADIERQAREVAGQVASVGAQVATCEQRIELLGNRCRELDEQIATAADHDAELASRIAAAGADAVAGEQELRTLELQLAQHTEQIEAMLDEQRTRQLELTDVQAQLEEEKADAIEMMRRTSQLHNDITAAGVRRESLTSQRQRFEARAAQIDAQRAELAAERETHAAAVEQVRAIIAETTERLEEAKAQSLRLAAEERDLDLRIGQAKERRSSLASRRSTLEEMQRKREGIADGVKRVLQARTEGRLPFVRGIVADFIRTDMEHAAVIESALSGMDQWLIVESLDALRAHRGDLEQALKRAGVEALCLDRLGAIRDTLDVASLPVPAERAIDAVQFDADGEIAPALWRLLGHTLIVADLAAAGQAATAAPAGYRFATRDGAVLEADGRVRIGQTHPGSGVISRRTELTSLAVQIEALSAEIDQLAGQRKVAAEQRAAQDDVQQRLRAAIYEANTDRVEHEGRASRAAEQLAQLERERPILVRDIETTAEDIAETVERESDAREKVAQLERLAAERQQRIGQLQEQAQHFKQRLDHLLSHLTDLRVRHAQAGEHRNRVHERITQSRRAADRMEAERRAAADAVEAAQQRRADAEAGIASARESIESLLAQRSELQQQAEDLDQSRKGLAERIEEIRRELVARRREQEDASAAGSRVRVEIGEADVRIENLITRATDELAMDVVAAFANYQHDDQRDWEAVDREIHELRGKIERLGNVNLDAITEQEELEQREGFLTSQLADVNESRRQLTELIEKINVQSKELFAKTFESIRANFQTIFRKLFGGGKADILLENPDDVLECGIEIIARPPGKDLRSITLLSGGEKTMTTVALLFSIFRSRPSPFCILDEVDAALDEANNERFNTMVREFLDQSQFIIITHSKRTMAIADVLYGVTMQEPGVSRRVSVKFEEAAEMVEDGEPVAAEA